MGLNLCKNLRYARALQVLALLGFNKNTIRANTKNVDIKYATNKSTNAKYTYNTYGRFKKIKKNCTQVPFRMTPPP